MGAGHTSDTDFVSNTSYFPLNDAAVFIRYGQSNFTSLAKTLAKITIAPTLITVLIEIFGIEMLP